MTFAFIPLICILFWSLVLGRLFGTIQLLFIGIITDLLMGTPLGSYLLLFQLLDLYHLSKRKVYNKVFYKNILAASSLIIFYILIYFCSLYFSKIIISEHFILNIILLYFCIQLFQFFFTGYIIFTSIRKILCSNLKNNIT